VQWIYKQPKLARMVGQALLSIGGFIIVCGMIGRVAMTAINSTRGLGKLPPIVGLKEAYPMYSLWWVPESFLGYAVAASVAAAGIILALTAKAELKKMKRKRGRSA
jgi:hypothetical protein